MPVVQDEISLVKVSDGNDGKDGVAGKDGVGLAQTFIAYAQAASGTTPPTSGWSTSVPTLIKGQFLWTKTVWSYTDDTTEVGYTVSYNAKDGNDGDDGIAGKDGVGISNTKIEYAGSSSGTVKPTSGWSTTIPAVPEGSFLWTKTTWSYTDNTSEVGYSVAKMGAKGDQGNQGIPGTPGADGKTPYTHWAYAWSVDGTDRFTTTYPGENLLLESGLAVKNSNYNINQYKMTDLMEEGKIYTIRLKGVLGTGKSHFGAWLDGGSISLGSFVNKGNGLYELTFTGKKGTNTTTSIIYIYTVYSSVVIESSIEWIKLEEGKSATIWTPSPTEDFEGSYPTFAGTYTDYESTDSENPTKYTWKRILGESGHDGNDGKDGANGQDAKEVISGYLSNESIIVPATAAGSVTDFSKAAGDFIVYEGQTKLSSGITYSKVSETWMTSTINSSGRYTVTALSADVGTATYQAIYKSVNIQKIMIVVKNKQGATGPAGSNGTDGKGIVSSATTYQAGTSGTAPPNGTWSSSIPSVSENQYLWTRVVLTYSDNTTSTAYSVGKMGAKGATGATGSTGAPGATGNGIKSTTINFASSTSGTVAPSSGWITSIPTVAAGNFLWTRTILTFTDNSTNTSYTVAKQGEKGDPTGIISQSTVPTNPYVGMLWQNTGASGYIIGATYQWNGSKFNLYIFTADNIVTTTLSAISANLGNITAGNISGVLISGSEFQNPFSNEPIDGGDGSTGSTASGIATLKGKLSFDGEIDTSHKFATEYGPVRLGGTVRLKTASPTTDPALMWWLNPYGLTLRVNGVGGTLRYQDLLAYTDTLISPNSGFSQYTTSGDNAPIVSRVGRIVQLSGAFKNNNELPINADMVMGVLPEWARPSRLVIQRQQASYNNTFLLTIKTDGTINMSRHAAGASNVTVPSGSWLNIAAMFSAKDF
ncbi:hypothetical protein EY688_08755 [Enterococcus casseliflavus]|nr:hypothetical protein [Enterococcus casseliflavus]MBO6349262.1 hypothetical protein [Enterococcus casseliflavus]MBO6367630.1 hypothetical protein [Enterococcus casseliflavus]